LFKNIWEELILISFLTHGGQLDAVAVFSSSLEASPHPKA
jgi:hypothetical protein